MGRKKRDLKKFWDDELGDLGLTHWYDWHGTFGRGGAYHYHEIGKKRTKKEFVILRLGCSEISWKIFQRIPIASIVGEPDSPVRGTEANCLRIQLRKNNSRILSKLKNLADKFRKEFGMNAEIFIGNNSN